MNVLSSQKIIRNKLGLLRLSEMLGSVSQAFKMMVFSRDSFYRFKGLCEQGGKAALKDSIHLALAKQLNQIFQSSVFVPY